MATFTSSGDWTQYGTWYLMYGFDGSGLPSKDALNWEMSFTSASRKVDQRGDVLKAKSSSDIQVVNRSEFCIGCDIDGWTSP